MTITSESTMAAVDAALAPALKNLDAQGGAVHVSSIRHVLSCMRQALAHAVYGAEPAPEPVVEEPEADADTATTEKLFG